MPSHPIRYIFCTALWAVSCHAAEKSTDQPGASAQFIEITRKEVTVGDHKIILIRVRPPFLPKAPAPLAPPPLTADQQATADRLAKKAYASLNLTATVYIGKPTITELHWRDDTGTMEYRAWSNADFRYLAQLPYIETPTTVYQWFSFIDAYPLSDVPVGQKSPIPQGLNLSTTNTDYVVDSTAKDLNRQETTLAGLDYLHAYYQVHYAELKAAFEKAQADNQAQEKQLRLHPPKTPDTTLRFWISANQ